VEFPGPSWDHPTQPSEAAPEPLGEHPASYWWPEHGPGAARPTSSGRGVSEPVTVLAAARVEHSEPSAKLGAPGPGARQALGAWQSLSSPTTPAGRSANVETSRLRRAWQRLVGALAAIAAFLVKFGALLIKLKYVGVVLSMFVSIAAYAWLFGWSFAVGLVMLLLVHEMGHVVVLRRQGVPASLPLFVPFLGAFVNMRARPRSAFQEAVSGLAGPAFGTAGAVAVAYWANATGSSFLRALAFFGFFMNLFNLLPVLPLDGGRAAAALHPALWLAGLVGLLAFEIYYPSPVVPIVLLLGGVELWRRWTNRNSPVSRAYHSLVAEQRVGVAAFYLLLVVVTIVGAHAMYVQRSL
jgi:Zn-dependent protease